MAEENLTENVDNVLAIKELEGKLENMKKDKEIKCKAAKEQLVEMLEVTVDKYLTATGTAEALRVIRFVSNDEYDEEIVAANDLAREMARTTKVMADRAKSLNYAEMDKLCDGFYDKNFVVDEYNQEMDLAYQMMCIDLCRNVGGAAEDMVSFIKRVQEEIDAVGAKLKSLRSEK